MTSSSGALRFDDLVFILPWYAEGKCGCLEKNSQVGLTATMVLATLELHGKPGGIVCPTRVIFLI